MDDPSPTRPVDFHCHLDLYPDMQGAFDRCERMGCTTLTVTTTPRAYARNRELAARTKHVHAALGLHPQLVAARAREIELFEELVSTTRFVGEIGLDAGKRHYPSFSKQKVIFDRSLSICARQGDKIISVHSARCARLVLDAISRSRVTETCQIVLHWFSASKVDIDRAIDLRCWFSVNEKMLRTPNGRLLIERAPEDRLLTETDCPFLEVDGQNLQAGDVSSAIELLSGLLKVRPDQIAATISNNADRILAT